MNADTRTNERLFCSSLYRATPSWYVRSKRGCFMTASLLLTLAEQEATALSAALRLMAGTLVWPWQNRVEGPLLSPRALEALDTTRYGGTALVERALNYPGDTALLWNEICSRIEAGDTAGLDNLHQRLHDLLYTRARNISFAWNVADSLGHSDERAARLALALEKAIPKMTEMREQLLSDWDTVESLEEKLLRKPSLAPEQVARLAEQYPPPQSWYDEDFSKLA